MFTCLHAIAGCEYYVPRLSTYCGEQDSELAMDLKNRHLLDMLRPFPGKYALLHGTFPGLIIFWPLTHCFSSHTHRHEEKVYTYSCLINTYHRYMRM